LILRTMKKLLNIALNRLRRFAFLDILENPSLHQRLSAWLQVTLKVEQLNVAVAAAPGQHTRLDRELLAAYDLLVARTRLDLRLWEYVARHVMQSAEIGPLRQKNLLANVARFAALS
jgi:hypothetical protein